MKKTSIIILMAAVVGFAACDNQEISPNKNYLPIVHGVVGLIPKKANDYLLKNGFVAANSWAGYNSRNDVQYIKANADSSLIYRVTCTYRDEETAVSEYSVGLTIRENGSKTACKMYADWSRYAYNTIFKNVSVWSASVLKEGNNTYIPETNYIDGSLVPDIKAVMDTNYAAGQIYQEEYDYLMQMFGNKRSAFDKYLRETGYLEGYSVIEGFAMLAGESQSGEGGVLDQKGIVGRIMEVDGYSSGEWFMSFDYDMNEWISDAVGPFFGAIGCE